MSKRGIKRRRETNNRRGIINKMPMLKDTITGETRRIHICYQCDPDIYPAGKPIDSTDWMARKDEKGNWICGDCQVEELNKRKLRVLGPNHPEVKAFMTKEDNDCKRWNIMQRE